MGDSHLIMPQPSHRVLVWCTPMWVERKCSEAVLHWPSWTGQAVIQLPTPLCFTVSDFKQAFILSWGGKAGAIPLAQENITTAVCQEEMNICGERAATPMHVDLIKQSGLSLLFVSTRWEQKQIGLEKASHRDIQRTQRTEHFNGCPGSPFFGIIEVIYYLGNMNIYTHLRPRWIPITVGLG